MHDRKSWEMSGQATASVIQSRMYMDTWRHKVITVHTQEECQVTPVPVWYSHGCKETRNHIQLGGMLGCSTASVIQSWMYAYKKRQGWHAVHTHSSVGSNVRSPVWYSHGCMDIRRDKVDTQHRLTVLWGGMSGHSTVNVIQSGCMGGYKKRQSTQGAYSQCCEVECQVAP